MWTLITEPLVAIGALLRSRRAQVFAGCLVLLCVAMMRPLLAMIQYSMQDDLYSHVILIPFISLYLACVDPRTRKPGSGEKSAWMPAVLLAVFAGWLLSGGPSAEAEPNDRLFRPMLAWVVLIYALWMACLGAGSFRRRLFPALFLLFVLPLPTPVTAAVAQFLQHASADLSHGIISLSGTPVFRDGLLFHMPRLSVEVAQECSGIRSSYVLFITSLVAGQLFLRSGWRKGILVCSVLPIAILRNAVRIVTISLATVHIDESVIDSPLHHSGGPAFFLLSLIPLFMVLLLLRWTQPSAPIEGEPE